MNYSTTHFTYPHANKPNINEIIREYGPVNIPIIHTMNNINPAINFIFSSIPPIQDLSNVHP